MKFNEYQEKAYELAQYPQSGANIIYPALGLAGETGEAVDKIKKIWRNQGVSNGKIYTSEQTVELAKELGDVLWYLAAICSELDIELEDVASLNIEKLTSRRERGVIKSEGDNR